MRVRSADNKQPLGLVLPKYTTDEKFSNRTYLIMEPRQRASAYSIENKGDISASCEC